MTRKDFQLIADVLDAFNIEGNVNQADVVDAMADAFAVRLARTNDRFDKRRFRDACLINKKGQ